MDITQCSTYILRFECPHEGQNIKKLCFVIQLFLICSWGLSDHVCVYTDVRTYTWYAVLTSCVEA